MIEVNDYPISHIEPMVDIDSSLPGAAQGYDLDGDGTNDIDTGTAHGCSYLFGRRGDCSNH